jgi:adenylate cyclase
LISTQKNELRKAFIVSDQDTQRRLTTILSADVVAYSALMAVDEAGALVSLKAIRRELLEPKTAEYHGRVVKLMGDGTLMEFDSAVDAVNFAVDVQRAMAVRNTNIPEARRIAFRVGINIGDVIVEGDDLYGDGVNVAARLEGLAEPGSICISGAVRTQVKDKVDVGFRDLGQQQVKNTPEPIPVFEVLLKAEPSEVVAGNLVQKKKSSVLRIAGGLVLAIAIAGVITVWQHPWEGHDESDSPDKEIAFLSGKPTIAILPFANMSSDAEQEYFADGITEDITTKVSQVEGIFVISRNSAFTYKGLSVRAKQISQELGVRYLLEGSVRRAGEAILINAQLIDGNTGEHL